LGRSERFLCYISGLCYPCALHFHLQTLCQIVNLDTDLDFPKIGKSSFYSIIYFRIWIFFPKNCICIP